MKILLVCKGEARYSFPAIAERLRSRFGCDVSVMTFTTPSTRMMEESGVFTEIHNLAAYLKDFVKGHGLEECIELLQKTPFAETLNTMVYADRIIKRYRFEKVVRIMAGVYSFWEDLFANKPPDVVVGEIACATEWVGYYVARSLDIAYLIPYPTPIADRVFFVRSPQGIWEEAQQRYGEVKGRDLTLEETRTAEDFLHRFRASKYKPPFLKTDLHFDLNQIAQRAGRIPFRVQTWMEDGEFEVGSYHGTPPWEPVWNDMVRVLRHFAFENLIFKRRIPEGRKVYFPLHVQPEYTTDVRAPFYTNQLAVVENIAKSVPMGYRVIVKEHPGMKGERPLGYYRQMNSLYNVDLLSSSIDGHDLILNSDVSLVISGTTAWESILYEKPVIAFGPLCYGYFDLVTQCEKPKDLPHLLSEAINGFRPNRQLLLKFIWSALSTADTFKWGNAIDNPPVMEEENLDRMTKAIFVHSNSAFAVETDPISMSV